MHEYCISVLLCIPSCINLLIMYSAVFSKLWYFVFAKEWVLHVLCIPSCNNYVFRHVLVYYYVFRPVLIMYSAVFSKLWYFVFVNLFCIKSDQRVGIACIVYSVLY